MECPSWHINHKDLNNLQSQPTHLSMFSKRQLVLAPTWAIISLPLDIKEHYKHMPRMQGKKEYQNKSPRDMLKLSILV